MLKKDWMCLELKNREVTFAPNTERTLLTLPLKVGSFHWGYRAMVGKSSSLRTCLGFHQKHVLTYKSSTLTEDRSSSVRESHPLWLSMSLGEGCTRKGEGCRCQSSQSDGTNQPQRSTGRKMSQSDRPHIHSLVPRILLPSSRGLASSALEIWMYFGHYLPHNQCVLSHKLNKLQRWNLPPNYKISKWNSTGKSCSMYIYFCEA